MNLTRVFYAMLVCLFFFACGADEETTLFLLMPISL